MDSRRENRPYCPYCACASADEICREMRPVLCQVWRVFGQIHAFRKFCVMFYMSLHMLHITCSID